MEAALLASREIGFTIISMTVSLVAVFIPVLFMGGIVGRLLHEFSVTITVAILISGFVSLSFTPMLGSRFLRHEDGRHGRAYRFLEAGFEGLTRAYDYTLRKALKHRFATVVFAIAMLGGTVYLFLTMPTGFIPSQDSGFIFGITMAGQDISFESMAKHHRAIAEVAQQDPNVADIGAFLPGGNQGFIFARLKPRPERKISVDQFIQELRPKLWAVPGMMTFLQNPPPITISGQQTQSVYQLTLQSTNLKEIYAWVPKLVDRMRVLPGFQDVTTDLQISSPQVMVEIDRDRALSLGVTPDQIQNALYTAFGSRQVSTIYTPSNEYQVITEVQPQYQRSPEALSKLYVRSSQGPLIPLDAVVSVTRGVGPLSVNHFGQLPAVTISFNLQARLFAWRSGPARE